MKQRTAWAAALVFAALGATFSCIRCEAETGDTSDVPAAIRYEANVSAGGVNPAGGALENPYKDELQSAQTGERLFSSMNCDGCHGGGALGSVGPASTAWKRMPFACTSRCRHGPSMRAVDGSGAVTGGVAGLMAV